MLGLLVILIASGIILYFFEKRQINVLGALPNKKRIIQFAYGILLIIIITLLNIFLESVILSIEWRLNEQIHYTSIFNAVIYHLKSALTEDLIFRGAILYILIQRIGNTKAILISAIAFGIYHVFSYGIALNKMIPVIYVIFVTGFTGYVWACAFYRTKSIYLGLAFHFGSNLVNVFFFESQPFGALIFNEVSRTIISEWNNFLFLILKGIFPTALTFLYIKVFYNDRFLRKTKTNT